MCRQTAVPAQSPASARGDSQGQLAALHPHTAFEACRTKSCVANVHLYIEVSESYNLYNVLGHFKALKLLLRTNIVIMLTSSNISLLCFPDFVGCCISSSDKSFVNICFINSKILVFVSLENASALCVQSIDRC